MPVLTEFLYSLVPLTVAVFAVLHVSEFAFFLSSNELTSFYAARSHFVDEAGEGLARRSAGRLHDWSRSPFGPIPEGIRRASEVDLRISRSDESHPVATARMRAPRLLPYIDAFGSAFLDTVLTGITPIPLRGGDESKE